MTGKFPKSKPKSQIETASTIRAERRYGARSLWLPWQAHGRELGETSQISGYVGVSYGFGTPKYASDAFF